MNVRELAQKVIQGQSRDRMTRFHDESGNLVGWNNMRHAPHALATTVARIMFDRRVVQPWISYRAQERLSRLIAPDATILEFGSGMSTVWFAQHYHAMVSIEHDRRWHDIVRDVLIEKHIHNVTLLLRDKECYAALETLPTPWQSTLFDFVMVDGIQRARCVKGAAQRVKKGGWVYLDNTDRKTSDDYQEAKSFLINIAAARGNEAIYYTDFVPGSFIVTQGMLVQL